MTRYSGVYTWNGSVRHVTFEAENFAQANDLAIKWGIGVEGEATALDAPQPVPEAYDVKTTCRMLGNVCRRTIDRDVALGLLERVEHTRRVLITRKSIEQRVRSR